MVAIGENQGEIAFKKKNKHIKLTKLYFFNNK